MNEIITLEKGNGGSYEYKVWREDDTKNYV